MVYLYYKQGKEVDIMANIDNLKEKVQKAEEKVEKKKATIARHEKQLAKKQKVLTDMGYDISDLEAIKWDKEAKRGSSVYYEVCDVEGKLRDIKGAQDKLRDAEIVLANWQKKLEKEEDKENFIKNQAPQVIVDFLYDWKEKAREWYIRRYDAYKKFEAELDAKVEATEKEIGIGEYRMPNREQKAILEEKGLDYRSVQKKKANFAGAIIMMMDNHRKEEARLAFLEKTLEADRKVKLLDLVYRINDVVGVIEDASGLYISDSGSINGVVSGSKAKANVETIDAGGWNIQCWHYRTLVHPIKGE